MSKLGSAAPRGVICVLWSVTTRIGSPFRAWRQHSRRAPPFLRASSTRRAPGCQARRGDAPHCGARESTLPETPSRDPLPRAPRLTRRPTAAAAPVPRCWRDALRPPHVRESARARARTANWSRPRRTAACCEPARRVCARAGRAPRHLRWLRPVPADGGARSASVGRLKLGGREIAPETTAALVAFCSFMLPNRLRVVV